MLLAYKMQRHRDEIKANYKAQHAQNPKSRAYEDARIEANTGMKREEFIAQAKRALKQHRDEKNGSS